MAQPRPKTLNFITGNANKLAEVRAILGGVPGLDLQSRDVKGIDEIQGSIEEIARDKCSRAAGVVSSQVLFDGLLIYGGWDGAWGRGKVGVGRSAQAEGGKRKGMMRQRAGGSRGCQVTERDRLYRGLRGATDRPRLSCDEAYHAERSKGISRPRGLTLKKKGNLIANSSARSAAQSSQKTQL